MSKKAIIVGAGIGGLATAVRLACKGYQVAVYEANAYPGGKLSTFSLGKYRFDAGPSLFTMPHFVDELFELAGEAPQDYFKYQRKKIGCQYFWQDGKTLTAFSDQNAFALAVEHQFNVPQYRIKQYLAKAKKKYDRTKRLFLEKSLHKWSTFLHGDTLIGLINYFSFEIGKSLHQANKQALKDEHMVQFYDRFATYNGSDPYQTPGIMTLVQHLEQHFGTYIPEKGMGAISQSVFELANRLGVLFYFNSYVEEIVVEKQSAIGIRVNDEFIGADVIVSNMDIVPAYKRLLPNQKHPHKILNQERSSSAVIFYWGIKKIFPQLDLHNIFFSSDYKNEFHSIFSEKNISNDPTIYVNITAKDVPEDAPKGCENWFVMINAPHQSGQDWDLIVSELRAIVIKKLSQHLGEDISHLIEHEWVMTPPIIEERTHSFKGALYGAASNNTMAAFLRHPNFSSNISNLYFCGGSVHPGGGIPLCLLSAKIVSDLIQ